MMLKYDVAITQHPEFDTVRAFKLQQLVAAANSGVFPPAIAGEIIIRMSDLPHKEELIERMQALIAQQEGAQQPAVVPPGIT